jgi:carbon monoxide dehydrogenase subunit G
MATITKEFEIAAPADAAWGVLRDFGALERLAPGFVTACALEEEGQVRRVTFFNGMEARERRITIDDTTRRIAYTAFGGRTSHYNAAAQVFADGPQRCRFVWTVDLLPDALAPAIEQMMERGSQAMRSALTPPARP